MEPRPGAKPCRFFAIEDSVIRRASNAAGGKSRPGVGSSGSGRLDSLIRGCLAMDASEAFARLVAVSEKLLHETMRLRNDVRLLNGRIIAIEEEEEFAETILPRRKVNILDAINEIELSRIAIRDCEHELSAIRARIDSIADNEASREEMRKFIVPRSN